MTVEILGYAMPQRIAGTSSWGDGIPDAAVPPKFAMGGEAPKRLYSGYFSMLQPNLTAGADPWGEPVQKWTDFQPQSSVGCADARWRDLAVVRALRAEEGLWVEPRSGVYLLVPHDTTPAQVRELFAELSRKAESRYDVTRNTFWGSAAAIPALLQAAGMRFNRVPGHVGHYRVV